MWPYWVMFLVPAWASLTRSGAIREAGARNLRSGGLGWNTIFVSVALLVGFRHEVGGDWGNYFEYLVRASRADLYYLLTRPDPGYLFLNWLSVQLDWGIYGVNLACGILFSAGLVTFCRSQPQPWLALVASVPYLLIVVAMGYSRQGVALGCAMIALSALSKGSNFWFIVWVVLGATFHKSAILLLPISALAAGRNRLWTAAWVGVAALLSYNVLLAKDVDTLYNNYIVAQYQSEGALVRLLMNALPATIFLKWRGRFCLNQSAKQLWTWMAAISLALLGAFFVSPSSTAVDRLALYLLPLQLVVASHLPYVFSTKDKPDQNRRVTAYPIGWPLASSNLDPTVRAGVVIFYGLVQFVWLNFAVNAAGWLPYKFYLFE